MVIRDREGREGVGASGGLKLPDLLVERVHEGESLEQAIDSLFGTNAIGEGLGMSGIMTRKVVTRQTGTEHGVAFALARFLHEALFA